MSQRADDLHHMLPPSGPGEIVLITLSMEKQIPNLQKPREERQKNMVTGCHMTKMFSQVLEATELHFRYINN